jgi:hypothetical protein
MTDTSPAFAWAQQSKHMGQLARGEVRWEVYLEVHADSPNSPVRGRIHFLAGERHRETAWIFLEWSEKEIRERFNEFSANELWSLVESLSP